MNIQASIKFQSSENAIATITAINMYNKSYPYCQLVLVYLRILVFTILYVLVEIRLSNIEHSKNRYVTKPASLLSVFDRTKLIKTYCD